MLKKIKLFKNLIIVSFFITSFVYADCESIPLFDQNKHYTTCRIVQHGILSYKNSSFLSERSCVNYCNSDEFLIPIENSLAEIIKKENENNQHRPSYVLSSIKKGNSRFVSNQMVHPHLNSLRRQELIKGQKPSAIIFSCSDSRVTPEHLMDQGLGDLFVVRTAGHVLGSSQLASMEYAVEYLQTSTIIVMGHEKCGAVQAALSKDPAKTRSIESMVYKIKANLIEFKENVGTLQDFELQNRIKRHTEKTIQEILDKSSLIKAAVLEGKVKIVPAFAYIVNGKIEFWESQNISLNSSYNFKKSLFKFYFDLNNSVHNFLRKF